MKRLIVVMATCLLALSAVFAGDVTDAAALDQSTSLAYGESSATEILAGAYQQIMWYETQQLDVPEALYDFFFKYEALVQPELNPERTEGRNVLDEFADLCPGTVIEGPDGGDLTVTSYGQTNNATNNCTYPNCRFGKDVVVQLEVQSSNFIRVTTTGSRFDTYLCLYEAGCCGELGSTKIVENNNNPGLCDGQLLAAGFQTCVDPGTYWLVLDGAGVAARGSYALTIFFAACE